jgi:hydrogenase-4 component H
MSWVSKFKEAVLCLRAGVVTLPYPAAPAPPPKGFRGRPIFDPNKCVGCGGCANNCPAREILLLDPCQEVRILRYIGRRCTYCGRCADVCPEKAITMSAEFETATDDNGDLRQDIEIFMGTCRRCGRCFKPHSQLEALMMTGYREDDIESERWIYRSRDELERDATARDIDIEID